MVNYSINQLPRKEILYDTELFLFKFRSYDKFYISNAEIIQKMLKSVKEQETEITYKMQSYAKVKRLFQKIKLSCIEIILVIRMKWKTNSNFTEMT